MTAFAKKLQKKSFTRGYKNDLLVITLAHSFIVLMQQFQTAENLKGMGVVISKEYRFKEGIPKMMEEIILEIDKDIMEAIKQPQHSHFQGLIKTKISILKDKVTPLLIKQGVDFEAVAMYLLFLNFNKNRGYKIDETFHRLTDMSRYELFVNSLESGGFTLTDKLKMYGLARDILKEIR